jgi:hypothetical protein
VEIIGDPKRHSERKHGWVHCADVVLGGDSQVGLGLAPSALGKVLGTERIKNFAFTHLMYDQAYFDAIDRILDPESDRPRVVLGVSPFMLSGYRARARGFRPVPSSGGRTLASSALDRLYQFFLPLPKRTLLKNWLDPENATWVRAEYFSDGWAAFERYPADPDALLEVAKQQYHNNRVRRQAVAEFLEGVERWTAQGVGVYAFWPPHSASIRALAKQLQFDEAKLARQIAQRGGVWLPVDASQWGTLDGVHLGRQEALRFSRILGEKILAVERERSRGR